MSAAVIASSPRCATPADLEVVESHRHLAGRRFSPVEEAQLLPDLLSLAASFARGSRRVLAIPEFVGPFGVADVVALVYSNDLLLHRLAAPVPPLVYEPDAAVVSVLTARSARLPDQVAMRLGWPEEMVAKRVARLVRIGAIERTRKGGLVRHPALVPVGRIHALEAKVRDWRRGCDQARRYRLWADTATVVLPRLPNSAIDIRGELRHRGVGLAVSAQWVMRPTLFQHTAARRLQSSELTIAALRAP